MGDYQYVQGMTIYSGKIPDDLPASEITGDGLTAAGTLGELLSLPPSIAVQLPPPKPPSYARLQALTMSLHWAMTSELLDDVLTLTEPTGDPDRKQVYEEMPECEILNEGAGRCNIFSRQTQIVIAYSKAI